MAPPSSRPVPGVLGASARPPSRGPPAPHPLRPAAPQASPLPPRRARTRRVGPRRWPQAPPPCQKPYRETRSPDRVLETRPNPWAPPLSPSLAPQLSPPPPVCQLRLRQSLRFSPTPSLRPRHSDAFCSSQPRSGSYLQHPPPCSPSSPSVVVFGPRPSPALRPAPPHPHAAPLFPGSLPFLRPRSCHAPPPRVAPSPLFSLRGARAPAGQGRPADLTSKTPSQHSKTFHP